MRTPVSRVEIVVGLFALLVIGLLLLALFNAARDANILGEDLELSIWIRKGQGLAPGSPVKINEVEIGRVSELDLEPQAEADKIIASVKQEPFRELIGPVRVVFTVRKEYASWIRQGTIAEVVAAPIPGISKSEIRLVPGPLDAALIENEDDAPTPRLETEKSDTLTEVFESLPKELMKKLDPTIEAVDAIIKNVRIITDDLAKEEGPLRSLINDREMADDVRKIIREARELTVWAGEQRTRVESILANVEEITANLAKVSDEAARSVPELKGRVEDLLDKVEPLIGQAKDILNGGKTSMENVVSLTGQLERRTGTSLDHVERLLQELVETMSRLPAIAVKVDRHLVELGRILVSVKRNFLIRGNLPGPARQPSEAEALPRGGQR